MWTIYIALLHAAALVLIIREFVRFLSGVVDREEQLERVTDIAHLKKMWMTAATNTDLSQIAIVAAADSPEGTSHSEEVLISHQAPAGTRAVPSNNRILRAAVKVDDVLYIGRRHCNCFDAMRRFNISVEKRVGAVQGFVDGHFKFLTRAEALVIAKQHNQIIKKHPPEDVLLSEDIY